MKTIRKYPLFPGFNSVMLPAGAKILTVHEQHGDIKVWAGIDTDRELTSVIFNVYDTEREINVENSKYIGTVFMDNGYKVWHVYKG